MTPPHHCARRVVCGGAVWKDEVALAESMARVLFGHGTPLPFIAVHEARVVAPGQIAFNGLVGWVLPRPREVA